MDEQLHTGKINEFIDWVSGENVFTGEQTTQGKKVSGGSIRQLLLERLMHPIVVDEDLTENLYRFFSSYYARDLYYQNPSDNAGLLLFTVPRPSDYILDLFITNAGDRYIKVGDDVSDNTRIQFTWKIHNDKEDDTPDVLNVTYTITNTDGSTKSFTRRRNHKLAEDYSLYEYLNPGENTVTIEAKGSSTGAIRGTSFKIIVLDLQVSCDFNFAGNHAKNEALRVPYSFYRNNNNGTAKIYFYVDGNEIQSATVDVFEGGLLTILDSGKMISTTLTEGQHSLQIFAKATYGSDEVYSNVLYFTFVVMSNEAGLIDKFINIASSFTMGQPPFNSLTLTGVQYYPQTLRWGYYTYAANTDTKLSITWKLLEGLNDQDPQTLGTIDALTGYEPDSLNFTPEIYTDLTELFLAAYYTNGLTETQLVCIPIYIIQNTSLRNIYETGNYQLKMTAYGRTNGSSDRAVWSDVTDTITTTFTNIDWNPNSGWYENSFRTSGASLNATIEFLPFSRMDQLDLNYPFTYGKTIEIDFESEKVNDATDKLIVIGNPQGARIEITPNTATLYDNSSNEVVHTNYKANERIKLDFIINAISDNPATKTEDDGLAYIVNNGILERGAIASGKSFATSGKIKIGGSNSGVRVYSIRIYDKAISYDDAYNNYVYDSDNKVSIVKRNDILVQGNISFDLCVDKIDTIVITGDLVNILDQNADKDDSETDVMIERYCYYDETKDFLIGDIIDDPDRPGRKKVVNGCQIRKHGQSTLNYPISSMKFWMNKSKSGETPIFYKTGQSRLLLNKNRYKMKDTSIPSNKFVLQANYADSSGVHNGGLLRLIQDSWYNARIQGVSDPYKLRTLPLLFSSIKSNEKANYGLSSVWQDYFPENPFPYDIRVSSDSFPCAVFYRDLSGSGLYTFLGQYVFMEDKKSDFVYGERSIYKVKNDPFCLTVTHKDEDTSLNRIWSNDNVLRMEVLEINKSYSSYMTTEGFDTFANGKYGWESQFEMIYPDPDDVEEDDEKSGISKDNPDSKFARKVKPFVDWYKWVVSTRNNLLKFQNEAADHLDLYKLAAYYIFVLRFALVDSLERNAQIKTYDGVHFHYEPWDMDIALGNKNDGGIAFNPPVNRNTKLNTTTYAISGKSADSNGNVISSNWLWDALEAWPYWMNEIIPKVADALFNTGVLTYDNVTNMFDNNYANNWCEIMYNKSGHFKYVESAGGDLQRWLSWLQGARMSHRHWWLSTSMDYYDAKWFCGDYKSHRIYLAANISADPNKHINIVPNGATYMTVTVNNLDENDNVESEEVDTTRSVDKLHTLDYTMDEGASTKAPIHIYGANYMEEIDMSDIAIGIDALDLTGTYSSVLGAPLRVLNVGTPLSGSNNVYTTTLSPSTCGVSPSKEGVNAFENLETLNIRGHKHLGNVQLFSFGINQWIRDLNMSLLKNFYAMGSNLTNFYSSNDGNNFNEIELPSTVTILNLKNSTWNSMTFWDTTEGLNDSATITYHETLVDNVPINIPPTITEVHFLGSTGRTRESLIFIKNWIKSIVATYGESALSGYTLEMDDVFWSPDVIGNDADLLTFDELRLIAKMNGEEPEPGSGVTKTHPIRGYIMLLYEGTGTELTASQLTLIRNWFGDSVFTKGSAGLVVDYKHNYIQINVGGSVSIINDEVYLYEGGNAILSATEFHLAEPDLQTISNYEWGISEPNSPDVVYQIGGVTLIDSSSTSDHNWYLVSQESLIGHNYDIEVKVTAGGQAYSTTIHVIAAKYPSSIYIDLVRYGNIEPRVTNGIVSLWLNGIGVNMFVTTDDTTYTASIRNITYTILSLNGGSISYSTKTGKAWEGDLYYLDEGIISVQENPSAIGIENTKSIRINCLSVPSNNDVLEYTITAVVTFFSNKLMTTTKKILVIDDNAAIVSALKEFLFTPIANNWYSIYGEQLTTTRLYRTDLLALSGTLTFSNIAPNDLVTAKGNDSLLDYIPNVTGLVFDNNPNITSTNNSIVANNHSLFVFDKMPNLRTLSILNCTGLTEDIDLSVCPNITTIDASGTNINVLIPTDSNITTYELGTPTSISIIRPTSLVPSGISVDGRKNITDLEIIKGDSLTCNAYNIFGKIMLNYFGNVYYNKRLSFSNGASDTPNTMYATNNDIVSERIYISPNPTRRTITESDGNVRSVYKCSYGQDDKLIWCFDTEDSNYDAQWVYNQNSNAPIKFVRIATNVTDKTFIRLKDYNTNEILFEWRK